MAKTYFVDTNVLLHNLGYLESKSFVVSSKTLIELEEIKTNRNKTEDVRQKARQAIRFIKDNETCEVFNWPIDSLNKIIDDYGVEHNADSYICAAAYVYAKSNEDSVFITNDISCLNIAKNIFRLNVEWPDEYSYKVDYTGFKEVVMDDDAMAYFYEHQDENVYDLLVNQYLIIKDNNDNVVDTYRWDGEVFVPLYKKQIKSMYFEKLKPKDIYQSCLIDSIMSNTITAVSAKAGAGKSLISLMCCMNLIENGKYDRIVILHNPTKARGAVDQGYYAGDAISKALQNSVGQMLSTKFGDMYGVELLIQQGKLKIVSLADCRGMEIRDSEILYMTETQNTTVDLIKLALSRVSSEAKVIIEGDYLTQTDSYVFDGENNGLRRVIEVFKGRKEFGYVELQNIWRSKIAELCELL